MCVGFPGGSVVKNPPSSAGARGHCCGCGKLKLGEEIGPNLETLEVQLLEVYELYTIFNDEAQILFYFLNIYLFLAMSGSSYGMQNLLQHAGFS